MHLCKDDQTSLTELVSDTEEMRTDCTLSDHSSIAEYRNRDRPEMKSVGKAARAYLVYANRPGARTADV